MLVSLVIMNHLLHMIPFLGEKWSYSQLAKAIIKWQQKRGMELLFYFHCIINKLDNIQLTTNGICRLISYTFWKQNRLNYLNNKIASILSLFNSICRI